MIKIQTKYGNKLITQSMCLSIVTSLNITRKKKTTSFYQYH